MGTVCPRCGRGVRENASFCGYCRYPLLSGQDDATGSEPEPPETAASPAPAPFPRQGWTLTSLVLLVFVLILAGLTALTFVAVSAGNLDREKAQRTMAETYYQQGQTYWEQGEYALANAEYALALELDPQHSLAATRQVDAAQKLATLQAPTPAGQVATAPAPEPSPQPTAPAVSLLQVREAHDRADWPRVLELSAEVHGASRAQQVELDKMRFDAYYQSGLLFVEQNKMAEAVQSFDEALALQRDSTQAADARQWAVLYIASMNAWGQDWSQAVDNLAQLYTLAPDYKDVRQRLYDAYLAYGDQLAAQADHCSAAEQYGFALAVASTPEVSDKQQQAQRRCAQAAPTPASSGPVPPLGSYVGHVVELQKVDAKIIYVRGKVVNRQGNGIEGAQVQIKAWDWKVSATTNNLGEFSFDGLSNPVTYTLSLLNHDSVPVEAPTAWHQITWVRFDEAQ
jgi:tetratricopeptide (TPR) repeat protein